MGRPHASRCAHESPNMPICFMPCAPQHEADGVCSLLYALQNQTPIAIHAPAPASWDDRCCIELLDDRGPRDRRTDIELVALVERCLDRLRRAEMDAPRALGH